MKKLGSLGIIGLLLLFGMYGCNSYNGLVVIDENVNSSWANVEAEYQRRADLIPNLVSTVQGAADFEQGTLTDVIEARAKATGITLTADELTPENMAKFQAAQDQLSGALSRLLVSVERYPDLKANQNFLELQGELTSTQNRIKVALRDFNETVNGYNSTVRQMPEMIIAKLLGFDEKAYFSSEAGAETAPSIDFDF